MSLYTRQTKTSPLRGFTLIETLVALTMGAVILTAALAVATNISALERRDTARAMLLSEGIFVQQALEQALSHAGAGLPTRGHIVDDERTYASVLVARPDAIGVLGDAPRPHTQYSTFGQLHLMPTGDAEHLAYHTENNGTCMPPACDVSKTSVFFPGDTTGCSSIGNRMCPWGLKRLEAGDRFMIVSGAGDYTTANFNNTGTQAVTGTITARLSSDWDDQSPALWSGASGQAPYAVPGIGFVTTLDRVFFRRQGNHLQRIQCWGDPVASAAGWPAETDNTLPSRAQMLAVTSPYDGSAASCTQWENLSTHVQSVVFSYFAGDPSTAVNPAAPGGKAEIRRVDYRIILEKTFNDGTVVAFPVIGSVAINNL